jgi:hypothetical protein
MVEGASVDGDEDLAEARLGFGDVGVAEDFGWAVVVEEDGFHGQAPRYAEKYSRSKKSAGLKTRHWDQVPVRRRTGALTVD